MFKPNFDEDAIKKLMNLKSDKIVQKSGAPKKDEGDDGDVTIRKIETNLVLFGKFNKQWYRFAEVVVNEELNNVPEIAKTIAPAVTPTYTSGWKNISTSATISAVHGLGSIPSYHRVLYATDLTNTKVYSLAVYTEGDEKCHYSLHYTDSIWSITGGAEDDEGSVNWGIYYNGSSWVQATTGYLKVDLWK